MRHERLLCADKAVLLVVDVQDSFAGHISDFDRVVERSRVMVEAAKLLEVPIIVTEQYPQGLGRTVAKLRRALGDCTCHAKVTFSCCQDEATAEALRALQRRQVLLVGIEAHVCIAQTAHDLLALDFQPYVAVDAVSSRRPSDAQVALQRLGEAGVIRTTTEAAIMEMTVSSKTPAFKGISQIIKVL